MSDELWQAFVQVAGAANALMLGFVLLVSPRLHRTRARRKLGWAFVAYAYLLLSFTAVDNGWLVAAWWVFLIDFVVVLLAAVLFLDYISDALGVAAISRAWYLTPVAVAAVFLVAGTRFIAGPAIYVVVTLQVSFSIATTVRYLRARNSLASRPHHLYVLLIGLWLLHVFQLGLLLAPDTTWLFDAVPLVGAGLMLTLTILVLTDSRTLRSLTQATASTPVSVLSADSVDRYMRIERPHLDPRVSLDGLASALGVSGRDLSQFVGASGHGNYYQFVNRYRVDEARRLLAAPGERRTSIEAIGLMAGFRSRSTFYEAFRRETGMTPAQYRSSLDPD